MEVGLDVENLGMGGGGGQDHQNLLKGGVCVCMCF